jgi:hypothetical protein
MAHISDITRIGKPIFVMLFVAGLIFAAALLLSTVINSAEPPPIETHSSPAASFGWLTPAAATA